MAKQDMPTVKGEKSKYAKKIIRKFGSGSVDPRWMWWLERTTPVVAALALLLVAATAQAETKPAKPVVCASYTIASTSDGGKLGVCSPSKEGGKPRYLRSFAEMTIVNPSTGNAESVLVGFQ